MGMDAQALAQTIGRAFGLEIRRNGPSARDDLRLAQFLAARGIELVFDIGANRGQFATQLFLAGYAGKIISFEAIPAAHKALVAAAAGHDGRWIVAPVGAISDQTGNVMFHVNDAEATSSLLAASTQAREHIAGLRPHTTATVPARRLDDLADDYGVDQWRSFIKIDVQGGEMMVLAGAKSTLAKIDGLVVELSLTEIYQGQAQAFEVLAPLLSMGFQVHDITPAYRDPKTYRLHQVDVVLFRARKPSASGQSVV